MDLEGKSPWEEQSVFQELATWIVGRSGQGMVSWARFRVRDFRVVRGM